MSLTSQEPVAGMILEAVGAPDTVDGEQHYRVGEATKAGHCLVSLDPPFLSQLLPHGDLAALLDAGRLVVEQRYFAGVQTQPPHPFAKLIRGHKQAEIQDVADTIKSLIQIPGWPLHLILSGVPSLVRVLDKQEELLNRSLILEFPRIRRGKRSPMTNVVKDIIERDGGLRCDEANSETAVARLLQATSGAFGTTIQFVRAAVETELRAGNQSVSLESFAKVYRRFTGCRKEQNIFLAKDWRSIQPANALNTLLTEYQRGRDE